MDDRKKKDELRLLRNYFGYKEDEYDYFKLERLLDEIKIMSKKDEIFQISSNCIYFIKKYNSKQTELFSLLDEIRQNLSLNITLEQIKKMG